MANYIMDRYPTHLTVAGLRSTYSFPDYLEPRIYANVSRYQAYRRIRDKEDECIHHETINQVKVDESVSDVFVTVDSATENRLDKIAHAYYGLSVYWWIIAMANNIIDPFRVPAGTVLRIPPVSSLYNEGGVLRNNG